MKFGEYLLQQQFTPWETEYLQYDRIKKVIRETNDAKIIDQWLQTEFLKIKNFISRQIDTLRYQLELIEQQQKPQPPSTSIKISGQLGDDLVYPLYDLHDLVRYLDLSLTGFKKLAKSYTKRRQQQQSTSGTRVDDDNGNINHEFIIKTLDQYYAPLNQLLIRVAYIKNNRSRVITRWRESTHKMKNLPPIPSPSPSVRDKGNPLPSLPRYDSHNHVGGDHVITASYWVHPCHVFELKTLLLIYATLENHHPLSTVYFDNNQWSVYDAYLNELSTDSIECTWPGLYHAPNGNIQINHLVHQTNNVTSIKQHALPWTSLDSCLRDLQRTSPLPPAKDRAGIRLSAAGSSDGDLAMATALIVEPRSKANADEQQQQQLDQALRDRRQQQQWQPMATCTCERTTFTIPVSHDHTLIDIHVDANIMMKEADSTMGGGTTTSGTRHQYTDLTMMTVVQHLKKAGDTKLQHQHLYGDSLGKEADGDTLKQLPTGSKQQEWPEWLKQLTQTCNWIHAVPRFSMYAHLVSRLYDDHVPFLPWWLGDFDRWSWWEASSSSYGLSRSIGLQPLLHGDTVSTLRTRPSTTDNDNNNKNHMTLNMDNNNDDNEDDQDDDDGKDIKMLLPKSTTPPTATTKNTPSISLPAMTTSARTMISHMMKNTTKRMAKPTIPSATVTTRTKIKVEPKVFFANERTFLSWLQFCALLLTVSLNMINFGGPDDSISRICGGMFIVITILLALYALVKYEFRAWNLLTRSNRYRFDDIYGPAILCFLLVVAMLINFGLRLNSSPPPPVS